MHTMIIFVHRRPVLATTYSTLRVGGEIVSTTAVNCLNSKKPVTDTATVLIRMYLNIVNGTIIFYLLSI